MALSASCSSTCTLPVSDTVIHGQFERQQPEQLRLPSASPPTNVRPRSTILILGSLKHPVSIGISCQTIFSSRRMGIRPFRRPATKPSSHRPHFEFPNFLQSAIFHSSDTYKCLSVFLYFRINWGRNGGSSTPSSIFRMSRVKKLPHMIFRYPHSFLPLSLSHAVHLFVDLQPSYEVRRYRDDAAITSSAHKAKHKSPIEAVPRRHDLNVVSKVLKSE